MFLYYMDIHRFCIILPLAVLIFEFSHSALMATGKTFQSFSRCLNTYIDSA